MQSYSLSLLLHWSGSSFSSTIDHPWRMLRSWMKSVFLPLPKISIAFPKYILFYLGSCPVQKWALIFCCHCLPLSLYFTPNFCNSRTHFPLSALPNPIRSCWSILPCAFLLLFGSESLLFLELFFGKVFSIEKISRLIR